MTRPVADRRLVLKRLGQAGAVLGASAALGGVGLLQAGRFRRGGAGRGLRDLRVADEGGRPPLVVARGGGPALRVRAAVAAAEGELVLAARSGFEPTALGGSVLSSWDVLSLLFEADRLVNVPVVKHHSLSHLTCGMKNHMGLIGGSRGRLHQEIHAAVVDLAAAFRPTLTVVDATRVMMRNGPTGGRLEDVAAVNAVAAGTDPVACDAWAARQLGLDPSEVGHVVLAEGRGLGRVAAGSGSVAEVVANG